MGYHWILLFLTAISGFTRQTENATNRKDLEVKSTVVCKCSITLIAFPEIPYENNIYSHTGNPPLSYFKCDTQKLDRELSTDPYCDIEDVVSGIHTL